MRRNNTLNSFVWLRVECNRRCCNSRSRSCPCGRGGDGGAGDAGGAYDVGGRAGVCAGVVVLETACTAWLLSCEEAVAPTAGSSSSNSGSTIAATTAIVVIIAVDAHVPIQVSRLRESMVDDGRQLIKVQFSLARFFFKVFLSKEKLF